MTTFKEKTETFLAQKVIAVVGLSRTDKNAANLIYNKLKSAGHTVYAVNPNTSTIEGDPCYASIAATPQRPDGVVIVTRPEVTDRVLMECAQAGIRHVWIHSSLIHGGTSVSEKAVNICKEQGIDVIAGGCPMMFEQPVDFGHKCMKWLMSVTGELPQ